MKTIKYLLTIFFIGFSMSAFAYWAYFDKDEDGKACCNNTIKITEAEVITYLQNGYTVTRDKPTPDCNDLDPLVWRTVKVRMDKDGDGYIVGNTIKLCVGLTIPDGYRPDDGTALGMDCNDNNPLETIERNWFKPCPADGSASEEDRRVVSCEDLSYLGYTLINYGPCTPKGKVGGDMVFSVTPNPASSVIRVTSSVEIKQRVEVSFSDQYGRVIKSVQLPNMTKDQSISVNTGDLTPGYYNVTIKHGQLVETKKIGIKI